jgi:SAM-dependent methyltransferase
LCGVGGYSSEAFASRGETERFPQSERESASFEDFFVFFDRKLIESVVWGRTVLDFGSGYGGRTVEYARRMAASAAWGVEPVERHVELSNAYAASEGQTNCRFLLCGESSIPLGDCSVDVVVSYDVLEHVKDPEASLLEIRRVLRPGGRAFLAFPVYHGAMSHHLDYVTRLPALHWFFSADTLVAAVNEMLREDTDMRRFGTPLQPAPALSHDEARKVLPTLNGLTGDGFLRLLNPFEVEDLRFRPLLCRRLLLGAPLRALFRLGLGGLARDGLTANVACVLRRPPQHNRHNGLR